MKVPILFKVTSSTFESELELNTMDNEPVRIHLKTVNKPDVNNLPNLYKCIGVDYEKKVLNSFLHESAKEVLKSKCKYLDMKVTATDLLVER
jgi:hypothetical protein